MTPSARQEITPESLTLPGGEVDELVDAAWRAREADRELASALGRPAPARTRTPAQYLLGLGGGPVLPFRTEQELILGAQAGDQTARARLVEAFLPHIAGVARVYRQTPGIERLELIQEGVVGLLRALRRYDPERQVPFWSYAAWWVRQAMQQLVAELTRPLVLSDHALRQLARVHAAERQIASENRRSPTLSELSDHSDLPVEQVASLLAVDQRPRSLDEPFDSSEGEPTTLGDVLADPDADHDYDQVLDAIEAQELLTLLSGLSRREREILHARYGLDGEEQTLAQVGARLGLTPERVRQLEQRALGKLRAAAAAQHPQPA